MSADEIYRRLHQRPFEPFRVHLNDGRVFEIRYPEINMITRTDLIIGIPEANEPDPIAERFELVALEMVHELDPLTTASP
jgi:hypothetical protein